MSAPCIRSPGSPGANAACARFDAVRAQTLALVEPLSEADCQVQSMPDASPAKWHLAHTTWFFETFVLEPHEAEFAPFHPAFRVLFNSYYNGIGEQHPRPRRGLVTRPGLADVLAYRRQVDERVAAVLASASGPAAWPLVELGLHHEQQHQELILTDLKHLLSCNPLEPVYRPSWPLQTIAPVQHGWVEHAGGLVEIGHAGEDFAYDNELPRHRTWLDPFAIGTRLVTHGEWSEFVADGGYGDPRWWMAAGWDWVRSQGIVAPLYWRADGAGWSTFTLHGRVALDPLTPVTHISHFEADAYARWRAATCGEPIRLPTEFEWEAVASAAQPGSTREGNFLESGALHPMPLGRNGPGALQMFGDVWEWTASAYAAYPGYRAGPGAVGEYNGKFMINQTVLRGGSCATPRSHIRATYRNFFPTDARWQFTGLRLARDLR